MSGGIVSSGQCLTIPKPATLLSTVHADGPSHSIVFVSTAQRQQATGAAQVGAHAAAGAAHVGAQVDLQQRLRTLQQRTFGQRIFGNLKQQDFLQQLLQPLLQQVGAGAQQLGAAGAQAAAAGAQQLGAHAAGAAQVGAGAAQVAWAQPQPLLRWWNRPASALLMLARQTSAAVIHANFILDSPTEAGPWNVRDSRSTDPDTLSGGLDLS